MVWGTAFLLCVVGFFYLSPIPPPLLHTADCAPMHAGLLERHDTPAQIPRPEAAARLVSPAPGFYTAPHISPSLPQSLPPANDSIPAALRSGPSPCHQRAQLS